MKKADFKVCFFFYVNYGNMANQFNNQQQIAQKNSN